MAVKQICIFIENKKGAISEVSDLLYKKGIDLRGIDMAEAKEFAVLRLITTDTEKATDALAEADYIYAVKEVPTVKVEDKPGSLVSVLKLLSDADISIEYTYLIRNTDTDPYMVISTQDDAKAEAVLKGAGFEFLAY